MSQSLRLVRLILALFCLGSLLGVLATAASAHTALVASEPSYDALLDQPPSRLVMRFSEPVVPLVFNLASPDGRIQRLEPPKEVSPSVALAVPAGLARGTHVLSWRVVSADGHPVGGTVLFSVGARSEPFGAGPRIDWPVVIAVWLTKLLLYAGLFVGVGGVAFGILVHPLQPAAAATARAALIIGLIAAPLALGSQGLDALGSPVLDIGRSEVWAAGSATAFGKTVAIALGALALGLLSLRAGGGHAGRVPALAALLGVGVALAASGHASNAPPQWAMRLAVCLHGLSVAVWIGGLLPLGIALQQGGGSARAALRRFSALIPYAVASLAASGLLLALVQMERIDALWTTAYGAVLAVKIGLLAIVFALAAFNRWSLTKPAAAGDAHAGERLVASIAVEFAVAILILAVVAVWRFTPPPRVLGEVPAQTASVRLVAEDLSAETTLKPDRAGDVLVETRVTQAGQPADAKEATFVFSNAEAGVGPITVKGRRNGVGLWQAEAVLPVPGRWQVRLDLLIDDFTLRRAEGEVQLKP